MTDALASAQEQLLEELAEIDHVQDEAGAAIKDLITTTPIMLPLIVPQYMPEADAVIYNRRRLEQLLYNFAVEVLESQARWAARWNKTR